MRNILDYQIIKKIKHLRQKKCSQSTIGLRTKRNGDEKTFR
jgi:hypothetical protein